MDTLNILGYGGAAVIIILLVVFELMDGGFGNCFKSAGRQGYEYYTLDNNKVRICKAFGSHYKVYVYGDCPVAAKKDSSGYYYFTVKARSASHAEHIIDELYTARGDK